MLAEPYGQQKAGVPSRAGDQGQNQIALVNGGKPWVEGVKRDGINRPQPQEDAKNIEPASLGLFAALAHTPCRGLANGDGGGVIHAAKWRFEVGVGLHYSFRAFYKAELEKSR